MKKLLLLFAVLLTAGFSGGAATDLRAPRVTMAASGTIATGQFTLSTTASVVIAAVATRHSVAVRNHHASISIYVGAAGVTSATGFLVKAGETITIYTKAAVYAVAASGAPDGSYLAEND